MVAHRSPVLTAPNVEAIVFSDTTRIDDVTRELARHVKAWHGTAHLSDEQLDALIRENRGPVVQLPLVFGDAGLAAQLLRDRRELARVAVVRGGVRRVAPATRVAEGQLGGVGQCFVLLCHTGLEAGMRRAASD